jgi:hypothetical protein
LISLYVANEIQYGKFVSAIMSLIIGWFLDDDHDFDTLMVTTLIGSVILFLLSLSTNVQAADASLLDIPGCEEIGETSPLTKHALKSTESNMTSGSYICYKPYSLFGEELSHISEEDASMLQRMATTNSASIRPLPRPASISSSTQSSCLSLNTTTHTIPTHAISHEDLILPTYNKQLQISPLKSISRNNFPNTLLQENSPPSFELARLPYPPPEAPVVVLVTLFPGYYQNHNYHHRNPLQLPQPLLPIPPQQLEEEYYYLQCSLATHYQQQSKWILKSLCFV